MPLQSFISMHFDLRGRRGVCLRQEGSMKLHPFAFILTSSIAIVGLVGCSLPSENANDDGSDTESTASAVTQDATPATPPKWFTDLPSGAFSMYTTFQQVPVYYTRSGGPGYTQNEGFAFQLKSDGTDLFISGRPLSPGAWQRLDITSSGCFSLASNTWNSTEHSTVEINQLAWGCLLENRQISFGGYTYERYINNQTGSSTTQAETGELSNYVHTWTKR
jgi:hypothetical protein